MTVQLSTNPRLMAQISKIKSDEHVVFFTTVGHLDETTNEWVLPVYGWIYEPENSIVRKAAFAKVLLERYGLVVDEQSRANFDRRVNLLLADNERGKRIGVELGGKTYVMGKSKPNGHFEGVIRVSAASLIERSQNGKVHFRAVVDEADSRCFKGAVLLWEPEGLVVISDIDDTVKVSDVSDTRNLLEYTFFLDFKPVPGMAHQYRAWADQGAGLFFVSSSPWHFYEPLQEFFAEFGFPAASASLKSVRLRDLSFLNLFKEGTVTKPIPIATLLERFPKRDVILVGDSGEEDAEVYVGIYHRFPDQVKSIYIRKASGSVVDDDRFSRVFAGVPADRWCLFHEAKEIGLREELRGSWRNTAS